MVHYVTAFEIHLYWMFQHIIAVQYVHLFIQKWIKVEQRSFIMLLFFFVCFVSLLFPPLDIGTPFQTVSNGVVHRVFVCKNISVCTCYSHNNNCKTMSIYSLSQTLNSSSIIFHPLHRKSQIAMTEV